MAERKTLKICIISSTRADWGLLSPLAKALDERPDCETSIIATNMHLSSRFGMTVDEIRADGFKPVIVEMDADADSDLARAKAMAQCLDGCATALSRIKPDMVVILGDRYEMLAAASAATMLHIPIVHIAGGTISEGAIDDSIRHAITKLSALHLVETEQYRQRVINMGEEPARVICTGAIGVWKALNTKLMTADELSEALDFDFGQDFAIATFHPATLDAADPAERCAAMLQALDRHKDIKLIITYPNNDARSSGIIDAIERYAASQPDRVKLVKSLGSLRYLSALQFARCVIGNSSSGIVEVASFGIPSIDIGIRQRGRIAAPSVIHCGDSADEIDEAINTALSAYFVAMAAKKENPYAKAETLQIMVDAIIGADIEKLKIKKFHDIKC